MNQQCEDLELYAAGILPPDEAGAFEVHLRSCRNCSQRIAQAYEAVATIESARAMHAAPVELGQRLRESVASRQHVQPRVEIRKPQASPRSHWYTLGLAAAAALAIALVPTWVAVDRSRTLQSAMAQDEQALVRIALAPTVRHAEFMAGAKPVGKVLYGAGGDWYYVVVMHPSAGMQVAYLHRGHRELLGRIAMHGTSGTLYLPVNHPMEELALLDGGRIVADAHLGYKGS